MLHSSVNSLHLLPAHSSACMRSAPSLPSTDCETWPVQFRSTDRHSRTLLRVFLQHLQGNSGVASYKGMLWRLFTPLPAPFIVITIYYWGYEMNSACSTHGTDHKCILFSENMKRMRPLWMPGRRWRGNINMDLKEIVCKRVDWFQLAQAQCRVFVNTLVNFRVT
jgi:hypothetical protein